MVKYFSSLCDYDTRYLHQLLVLNFYYFTKLAIYKFISLLNV